MPNFDSCQFGPLALRRLLRQRLLIGERVIGWGVANRQARSADIALIIFLSMIPIVGSVITAFYAGRFKRFIVLTDARLLMIDTGADAKSITRKPPLLNVPLHSVSVATASKRHRFRIRARGLPAVETYHFKGDPTPPTQRLIDALNLLAQDSDTTGRLIDPPALLDPPEHAPYGSP
ncbi:MAG: hypothetical protein ACTS3F_04415 [Phycisphaerales bacterium]